MSSSDVKTHSAPRASCHRLIASEKSFGVTPGGTLISRLSSLPLGLVIACQIRSNCIEFRVVDFRFAKIRHHGDAVTDVHLNQLRCQIRSSIEQRRKSAFIFCLQCHRAGLAAACAVAYRAVFLVFNVASGLALARDGACGPGGSNTLSLILPRLWRGV